MPIRAGQIIHDIDGYVIDRIQTGGPGALNIPQERIYELGNYNAVAIVRDIPDLTFDLESVDVSTEFESILLAKTPKATPGLSGDAFDFNLSLPIDVISPFKSNKGRYDIIRGLAIPCLSLERVTYRFGVRQSAMQMFSLRGDSIYYLPGTPHWEEAEYAGGANQTYNFSYPGATGSPNPITFTEQGNQFTALSVSLINKTTGTYKRLFFGSADGYTQGGSPATAESFTIPTDWGTGVDGFTHVRWTYGSDTQSVEYPQSGYSPHNVSSDALHKVHQGTSVKPAAVRGKDIKVYVAAGGTANYKLFRGVQTVEMTRSVNLENDEELGNHHYVSQDYVTPDVTGSFSVRPLDTKTLWDQIYTITGVNPAEAIGPQTTSTVNVKVEILDPDSGSVLKTVHVPDARFQVPGLAGRANQKLDTTFTFSSDGGIMGVYDGTM
jgi:hypothetical protein